MADLLRSDDVNRLIDALILTGKAQTASQAEELFLDSHLLELVRLVNELSDEEFRQHEAIKLLMSHGSRRREDALP